MDLLKKLELQSFAIQISKLSGEKLEYFIALAEGKNDVADSIKLDRIGKKTLLFLHNQIAELSEAETNDLTLMLEFMQKTSENGLKILITAPKS